MALTSCSDLSAASWLTTGDVQWEQLVTLGPAGFPAYARLRFLPDPTHEGQSENDVVLDEDAPSETTQLKIVLDVLSRYTRTAADCYFCLWDGWGLREAHGAPTPAAQGSGREAGSMVVVPHRAYLLFRGAVADLGERGSRTRWPGQPHLGYADPAFVWPADRAWCIANDVDPHWAGLAATASAIDELVAEPRVDVVRADPRAPQPRYR